MTFMDLGEWQIHDQAGRRKYLNDGERRRFLAVADKLCPELRSLCHLLALTGCRISEALALKAHQVDPERKTVTFRTLKRRRLRFRVVPVPAELIEMLTDTVKDIHLSLDSWLRQGVGCFPDLAKAKRISAANLRTATDAQLRTRLGLRRDVVKSVLTQAIKKMDRDQFEKVTKREQAVFNYLAGALVWNPAFTDKQVLKELAAVLTRLGALQQNERAAFDANQAFLALYVTALMHDSAVVMDDGSRFELVAGFDNDEKRIEVKAHIELAGWGKPVTASVCIFWTTLIGAEHCSDALVAAPGAWNGTIEIARSGRLDSLA